MFETPNFAPLAAEMFVLAMACVVMLVDLFFPGPERRNSFYLSMLTLFGAAWLTLNLVDMPRMVLYTNSYVHDTLAVVLKLGLYAATAIALLYARAYIASRDFMRGEYYLLTLFSLLGMMVLVSAYSMLTIYLGLELLSLSLYAMVAMQRDSKQAPEAAMKYFVMGALASGFLLFGISMLYGATGAIDVASIAQAPSGETQAMLYRFALVFIVAGIAFKLGAVPFHMWIPDIYHGAPTSVVAFLGSAPKIAAFGMITRLLVEALPQFSPDWRDMLAALSIASMAVGNIGAVMQTNFKRLLAYSAIAHMGYFLIGFASGSTEGYSASMFYVLIYALMTLGGFGMVLFLSRHNSESDELADLKGLWHKSPWYAAILMLIMMSMAGIPPFIGFWPKLQVFLSAVHQGMYWLAGAAAFFSVVGCYVYLKVVKVMFFEKCEDAAALTASRAMRFAISANGLALLALGVFPSTILAWCAKAFM